MVITNKAVRPTVTTADKQIHKMIIAEYNRIEESVQDFGQKPTVHDIKHKQNKCQ